MMIDDDRCLSLTYYCSSQSDISSPCCISRVTVLENLSLEHYLSLQSSVEWKLESEPPGKPLKQRELTIFDPAISPAFPPQFRFNMLHTK